MGAPVKSFRELNVYLRAFHLQQQVFTISGRFPTEERYALTSQIRRSSRAIGANLSEAWQKRRYIAHFVSKLTDADGEQCETQHWIDTSYACNYISQAEHAALLEQCTTIGRMLGSMIARAEKFCHP